MSTPGSTPIRMNNKASRAIRRAPKRPLRQRCQSRNASTTTVSSSNTSKPAFNHNSKV